MKKIDRNTTNIIRILNDELKSYKKKNTNNILKNHQFIIKEFYKNIEFNDTKGLLLYHKMGTGKTILSISIALDFNNDVIVFINSSLINNFINDIKKYLKLIDFKEDFDGFIKKKFTFISLNAYNLMSNIPSNLKNKLIIIDEAHHLFSGVINASKNFLELYYSIRNEIDLKLLLLTGTPINNDPYELMICMNLLSKITVFPESYQDFNSYFKEIKEANPSLYQIRLNKLQNRLIGLISFYEQNINDDFPFDLGIEIIKCNMTKEQTNHYLKERNLEEEQVKKMLSFSNKKNINTSISKSSNFGSYRIKSRMLCNRYLGDNINDCFKFNSIYNNILSIDGCSLVYSQFINEYGLIGFSQFLLNKGYELFDFNDFNKNSSLSSNNNNLPIYNISDLHLDYLPSDLNFNNIISLKLKNKNDSISPCDNIIQLKKKYFSIIKGDISFEQRNLIQQIFNNSSNANGDIIHILLVSSTGAEGLDLKFIRSIHILEPYWNFTRIEQIKARGIRFKSHDLLPKIKKNVQTYIYQSSLYSDELTSDEDIFLMSNNNKSFINDFLNLLKKVSIDCIFYNNDCSVCNAINKKLFTPDFNIDIYLSNPCFIIEDDEIDVTHVKNDIYYSKDTDTYYKLINGELIKI